METTIIKSEIEQPTFVRNPLLNLFQKDVKRDLIYADVVGYQLDLSTVIDEYNRQNHIFQLLNKRTLFHYYSFS